jgi:hypothetical protein
MAHLGLHDNVFAFLATFALDRRVPAAEMCSFIDEETHL